MRVLGGHAKGLNLDWVSSNLVRPTAEKVKEAFFDIIQFDIIGKNFLDLFGGTGQIGIEAASRDANQVVIVEKNILPFKIIQGNLKKLSILHKIHVIKLDSIKFLDNFNNIDSKIFFDIAFLDPPFNSNLLEMCIPKLINVMSADCQVIIEISKNNTGIVDIILNKNSWLDLKKIYNYGTIVLVFFERKVNLEFEH